MVRVVKVIMVVLVVKMVEVNMVRDALFDSSLFTETWSFCLFFSPIVTAVEKKQLMAAALTAEQRELLCTAVYRGREKTGGSYIRFNMKVGLYNCLSSSVKQWV